MSELEKRKVEHALFSEIKSLIEQGRQIVNALSAQLVLEYGNGWSGKHLHHCLRTAETIEMNAGK